LFGQNVGPEGRVVAIEAHPMIAKFLRRNIVDNNLMNTTIENVAVTGIPGYVTLFEGSKGNLGSTSLLSSRCTGKPLQVKASTLMNLLADVDLNKVSVIKIDIEGAEGSVVEEILQNLDCFPQRLTLAIEANLTENGEWHDFFGRFLEAGFKAARLDRDYDWDNVSAFQSANLSPIDHLEESVTDVLFYRGDERIQRLLRRRRDALPRRLEAAKRQRSNLEAQATQ
ncbi:MAG: FkbM family methyltransferase, partial [Sphingomicrobium sp.]